MVGPETIRSRLRAAPLGGICLSLLLGGAAVLAGCSKSSPDPEQARSATAKGVPVDVAAVVQQAMPVEIAVIGNVQAYAKVNIKSQVNGQIMKVGFKDGQDVKRDDLLFLLDTRPFQAALDLATANLARDNVQMKNAEAVAARNADLLAKGFLSQEEYDTARTSADAFSAAAQADKAAIELAKVQLDYCTIRSPMDARAGAVLINEGNLVKANDIPMVVLNQITPIYLGFSVAERYLPEIRKRMAAGDLQVQAIIPTEAERPENGVLTFIDNTVDPTTGTVLLKGTFQNPERRLWPGQYVNVILKLGDQPDAIVVPSRAVQVGQTGTYVFVVKPDMTVESRPVVVDREIAGQSVIAKGLSPQETVVTEGQLRLVPGAKVEARTQAPSGKAAGS
jgi:multidrug efflux system membrane fusion protein